MTSTASKVVIDWIIAVEVSTEAQPQPAAQPAPAPAPDVSRLYRPDVLARARELYAPPHYLTTDERIAIAAQLDAEHDLQRAAILHKYSHVNTNEPTQYSQSGIYGAVGTCTPSQSNTITGRG